MMPYGQQFEGLYIFNWTLSCCSFNSLLNILQYHYIRFRRNNTCYTSKISLLCFFIHLFLSLRPIISQVIFCGKIPPPLATTIVYLEIAIACTHAHDQFMELQIVPSHKQSLGGNYLEIPELTFDLVCVYMSTNISLSIHYGYYHPFSTPLFKACLDLSFSLNAINVKPH